MHNGQNGWCAAVYEAVADDCWGWTGRDRGPRAVRGPQALYSCL